MLTFALSSVPFRPWWWSCSGPAASIFQPLVIVHALAATLWTGGHLLLDLGVLPNALRERSASAIRSFEETSEPLGLTALAIQLITGLWTDDNLSGLAWHIRGITALAVAFVVVGALIRLGGLV